jgi:SAM-dependent methyltransferase
VKMIQFGRDNERRRNDWVRDRLARLPKGARILDAGAGELRNRAYCSHLAYVSQDICEYEGKGDGQALQMGNWDTSGIDIISDITAIPEPDATFDAIVCTEVFEHLPDPVLAVKEFARLVRPGGAVVITAPFCSLTHFAPYHFATGLSRYWYEQHLPAHGLEIVEIVPNGGWFDYLAQELWRLPFSAGQYSVGRWLGWLTLLAALPALAGLRLLKTGDRGSSELLTFGWQIVARRSA